MSVRFSRTRRVAIGVGIATLAVGSAPSFAEPSQARLDKTLFPIPMGPVDPTPCPPPKLPPGPPGKPPPPPQLAESSIPTPKAPPQRKVDLAPIAGKGIWVTVFPGGSINAASLVATAHADGLDQIWIRTGSTHDGYYGAPLLSRLLPLAHAAGISVIAWDFPTMSNPAVDAERAVAAVRAGVDGFSPDIETQAEGTYLTARRVAYYLSLVRSALGKVPIVATVPRPLAGEPLTYPYAAEAPFVDAFAPMVYWSCNEPGTALAAAMVALQRLRPVAPIGQAYDMASEGGRHGLPTAQEIWRFLDVAHKRGALGASLYDIETSGSQDLLALARYPWTPTG
ncbi:MAG TPA: hypothetical protein VG368_03325 [Acidimicrobiales bacterium]|nr:hypothetical protein [Acidimicrobiales bacterium]